MAWTRFVFGSDVHGDKQDPAANKVFFRFVEEMWKPKIRIMGGDLWDFRPLRRKASEDERRESMAADYRAGMKWLHRYKPTHFLRGNHDERLWELAQADKGVESDYALNGVDEIEKACRLLKCVLLPYHKRDGVLRLGSLKVIHGFFAGVTAARQHALVYGSCLYGHTHADEQHSIAGLEPRIGFGVGALCQLDMEYNSRHVGTLRQTNGFGYGVVNEKTGHFHVWKARSIEGEWLLPSDIVQL